MTLRHDKLSFLRFLRDKWRSWKRASVQVEDEKKAKFRIIEGMQNGRFNQSGTLNHAVPGDAINRIDGGHYRDFRKSSRASS